MDGAVNRWKMVTFKLEKHPMTRVIDLRSDTVTRPTQAMRKVMMWAEVGDDILRDDPTVLKLEALAANIFGKEAAMLTISGTMSNQIALAAYTRPGDEIVVLEDAHIYNLECAAASALNGVQARPLPSDTGTYDKAQLEKAIRIPGIQHASTRLICLENSFHLNRGLALDRAAYEDSIQVARDHAIPIYMDGARIFNAAVALHCDVKDLTDFCDAVALCLCKGLGAPLGSLLIGRRDFIDEARWIKQRFGGGMRQAGVIAAPGILALTEMVDRLAEDHTRAADLRVGLENMGIQVDRGGIPTNIVNLDVSPTGWKAQAFADQLVQMGIKVKVCSENRLRMALHHDIQTTDVEYVLQTIGELLKDSKAGSAV